MKKSIKLLYGSILAPIAISPIIATSCNKEQTYYSLAYNSLKNMYIPKECWPDKTTDPVKQINLKKGTYTFEAVLSGTFYGGEKFYLLQDTGGKAKFSVDQIIWTHPDETSATLKTDITTKWQYNSELNELVLIDATSAFNVGSFTFKIATTEDQKCTPELVL